MKKEEQKSFWINRVIPALIIGLVLVIFLTVSKYSFDFNLYKNFKDGVFWFLRTLSILIFVGFAFWIYYELSKAYLQNHKIFKWVLPALAVGLLFAYPNFLKFLTTRITPSESILVNKNILQIGSIFTDATYGAFSFFDAIWPLTITLIFVLIRFLTVKNINLKYLTIKALSFFFIFSFLTYFLKSFMVLLAQTYAIEVILLIVFIAMSCDIGGYFGGKLLGHKFFKQKLAPAISPKKTIEGAIVGIIVAIVVTLAYIGIAYGIGSDKKQTLMHIMMTPWNVDANSLNMMFVYLMLFIFLAPMFAICGDLAFSLIKRRNEIKDFSNILREHGGILDRLDSISFVFILFITLSMFAII
ncbi:phosphatidate cytidylyltransferase [Mycoplasma sp. 2704]|uniref:phosphatidate cytidylyltransferase n=1 Tax=Mycoplasma sp. 2704 TaxID=3108529 RepID=UPI002B1D676B|nr:phosphatidate cytidylyltransferase [Mycoplasma sp. 2704]MEA4134744.1 phosphatidate cytidylyltransferase [Mycoplasma sp. 2704]